MSDKNWVAEFLKSLDEDKLKELLKTVALITDPLSQELMKKAISPLTNYHAKEDSK